MPTLFSPAVPLTDIPEAKSPEQEPEPEALLAGGVADPGAGAGAPGSFLELGQCVVQQWKRQWILEHGPR